MEFICDGCGFEIEEARYRCLHCWATDNTFDLCDVCFDGGAQGPLKNGNQQQQQEEEEEEEGHHEHDEDDGHEHEEEKSFGKHDPETHCESWKVYKDCSNAELEDFNSYYESEDLHVDFVLSRGLFLYRIDAVEKAKDMVDGEEPSFEILLSSADPDKDFQSTKGFLDDLMLIQLSNYVTLVKHAYSLGRSALLQRQLAGSNLLEVCPLESNPDTIASSLKSIVFLSKESFIDEAMKELFLSSHMVVDRLDRLFSLEDFERPLPRPSEIDRVLLTALLERQAPELDDLATAEELSVWVESVFQGRSFLSDEYDLDTPMVTESASSWITAIIEAIRAQSNGMVRQTTRKKKKDQMMNERKMEDGRC